MTETSYRISRVQLNAFLVTPRHAVIAAGPSRGTYLQKCIRITTPPHFVCNR